MFWRFVFVYLTDQKRFVQTFLKFSKIMPFSRLRGQTSRTRKHVNAYIRFRANPNGTIFLTDDTNRNEKRTVITTVWISFETRTSLILSSRLRWTFRSGRLKIHRFVCWLRSLYSLFLGVNDSVASSINDTSLPNGGRTFISTRFLIAVFRNAPKHYTKKTRRFPIT